MSILIDNVRISAFGGLRRPLSLNLSAPLTLIYAPNGTGKTSVIESIDWLLGGDVREERCKLATDEEVTEVTIGGVVSGVSLSAKKSFRIGGKISRVFNGVSVGEADFLKGLAPECDVSELSALARIPRLKAFLSANRVLGVGSLSRLIDGESADARADAMADLTGTRAQRNAQKVIDLYRKKLREKLSRLSGELEELSSRQREYFNLSASRSDAEALMEEVLRILSATEPASGLNHSELVVRANYEFDDLGSKAKALERLRVLLRTPPDEIDTAALEQRISTVEVEIQQVRRALEQESTQFQALGKEQNQITREAEGVQVILDALLELQSVAGVEATFNELSSDTESLSLLMSDSQAVIAQLNDLARASGQAAMDLEAKRQLEARISLLENEASEAPAREVLEMKLAEKHRDLARSRTNKESVRTLKNEAVRASLIAHHHLDGDSSCPACGHDWVTYQKLGEALSDTLLSLPHVDSLIVAHETSLLAEIDSLQAQVDRLDELLVQLGQVVSEFNRINVAIQEADSLAARFGFSRARDVRDSDISCWRRRLRLAGAYLAFDRARSIGHIAYLAVGGETLLESARSLRSALASLRASAAEKSALADDVSYAMDSNEVLISSLGSQLAKLREQYHESDSWGRRIDQIRNSLGLSSLSSDHIGAAEMAVSKRADQLRMAISYLKEISEIRTTSALAEKAAATSLDAQAVSRDVNAVQRELERIDSIDAQIESQSEVHRGQLIETVGPSVSQLFQRMQVNRVFDSVAVSSSFELNGLLEEHLIEPELFSSGQRQDLALAFFLVRAYSLGGSFFLDEPLAHLDDLNRVAVLDTLRAFVLAGQQRSQQTRMVITTASWTTTKHIIQKFMRISGEFPLLRAYQLTGNVSSSVSKIELFPTPSLVVAN